MNQPVVFTAVPETFCSSQESTFAMAHSVMATTVPFPAPGAEAVRFTAPLNVVTVRPCASFAVRDMANGTPACFGVEIAPHTNAATGPLVPTVSVSAFVPVPPRLVALSVTANVPAAVGAPLMNPLAEFTERPAGRPVASYEVGEFVAMIW